MGWARADIADDGTWSNLEHGIKDLKECALWVASEMDVHADYPYCYESCDGEPRYDLVVCERWSLYATHAKLLVGSEIPSAQFVGMVKLSCWLAGVLLVMQPAAKVNSNKFGVLAPAERSMKKLRPELFELVTQPVAHDDGHDLVAIKHLWAHTFDHYPVKGQ